MHVFLLDPGRSPTPPLLNPHESATYAPFFATSGVGDSTVIHGFRCVASGFAAAAFGAADGNGGGIAPGGGGSIVAFALGGGGSSVAFTGGGGGSIAPARGTATGGGGAVLPIGGGTVLPAPPASPSLLRDRPGRGPGPGALRSPGPPRGRRGRAAVLRRRAALAVGLVGRRVLGRSSAAAGRRRAAPGRALRGCAPRAALGAAFGAALAEGAAAALRLSPRRRRLRARRLPHVGPAVAPHLLAAGEALQAPRRVQVGEAPGRLALLPARGGRRRRRRRLPLPPLRRRPHVRKRRSE